MQAGEWALRKLAPRPHNFLKRLNQEFVVLLWTLRLLGGAWIVVASVVSVSMLTGGCPGTGDNMNQNINANANANTNDNGGGDNENDNSAANENDNSGSNANQNSNGSNANDNGSNNSNGNSGNGNNNTNTNDNGGNSNSNSNSNSNANTNQNDNGDSDPTQITLSRIVQTGDSVPGEDPPAEFTAFGEPIIDADGRIAFWATYANGNGTAGLYVFQDGALERVVDDDPDRTGEVPGGANSDNFGPYTPGASFDPLAQSIVWGLNGRLLFGTRVSDAVGTVGIYRWRATDGDMIRVANTIEMAELFPDAYPNGAGFTANFSLTGVSDGGIVAFTVNYTYFRNPSNELVSGAGVFTGNGNSIAVLADRNLSEPGDVPSQGDEAFFSGIGTLCTLNIAGDIIFQSRYTDGTGAGGVYLARGTDLFRVIDDRSDSAWPGLAADVRVGNNGRYDTLAVSTSAIAVDSRITQNSSTRDAILLFDWDNARWSEVRGEGNQPANVLLTGLNESGEIAFLSDGHPHLGDAGESDRLDVTFPLGLGAAEVTWGQEGGALNNRGHAVLRYTRTPNDTPGLMFWTGSRLLVLADPREDRPESDIFEIGTLLRPERDHPGRSGALNDSDEAVFRIVRAGNDGDTDTADDIQAIYVGRGN